MNLTNVFTTLFYPLAWIVNWIFWLRPNPFLKILRGEAPADFYHQDSDCVCFRDIHPAADFHALVVPRKSVSSWTTMTSSPGDLSLLHHMVGVAREVAEKNGISDPVLGFMTPPYNSVFQLHLHVLSKNMTDRSPRGLAMKSWWFVSPAYVYVALKHAKSD